MGKFSEYFWWLLDIQNNLKIRSRARVSLLRSSANRVQQNMLRLGLGTGFIRGGEGIFSGVSPPLTLPLGQLLGYKLPFFQPSCLKYGKYIFYCQFALENALASAGHDV